MAPTKSPTAWLKLIGRGEDSPTPKYHQLKEIIREQCMSWEPHQAIPSEAELCQAYAVSRTTVRKALEDLTQEGLLYRIQGKGTFLSPPKLRERFVQQTSGFYEDMMSRGVRVTTRILEQLVVPVSRLLAQNLQIEVGDPVVKLSRLRAIEGEPLIVSTTFLPCQLFPGLETDNLVDASLYGLLREKYGIRLGHGTRLVEASPCSDDDAHLLRIAPGTPMLVVSGTMTDVLGRPVETGSARIRGDRSQIEIEVITH